MHITYSQHADGMRLWDSVDQVLGISMMLCNSQIIDITVNTAFTKCILKYIVSVFLNWDHRFRFKKWNIPPFQNYYDKKYNF
jgi:hypothetical protein